MKNMYTLITGGSEGIGFEIGKLYASQGNNLILVGRTLEKLERAKKFIENTYKNKVEILSLDLSVDNSCEKLFDFVEKNNLSVDKVINNAGIGSFGFFHEDKTNIDDIISLNILSLTKITKYFYSQMVTIGYGEILNVASTAAFSAGPKMSLYYATKAYVLSLTESLYEEGKQFGVKVCCLCPGPVKTEFQSKSGIKKAEGYDKYLMNAKDVALIAYLGLENNKGIIIPGFKNKILVFGAKIMPRRLSRKIILKNNS